MAYDEDLAARIRALLAGRKGVSEKKMFGGLAFMLDARMCCGVVKDELMVRIGEEREERALAEPHVRPMDFTGRPMKGFLFVAPGGLETEEALRRWIEEAAAFVASLPEKSASRRRR